MKHKGIRIPLVLLEAFVAVGAIGGGLCLLTGAFNFRQGIPLVWLAGTPFSDYTIPGLILLIVVGGGMLIAAATQFVQREWAVLLSAAMGLIMIGWIIVEVAIIDRYEQAIVPPTVVQQVLFPVLGLVIFGLAAYLWVTEYSSVQRRSSHLVQR
jgi:hypothetical protein